MRAKITRHRGTLGALAFVIGCAVIVPGCQQLPPWEETYTVAEAIVPDEDLEPPLPTPPEMGGRRPTPPHCPGPTCAAYQAAIARQQIVDRNVQRFREQLLDEPKARERYLRWRLALPRQGPLAGWERSLLIEAEHRLILRIHCAIKREEPCGPLMREDPPECLVDIDPELNDSVSDLGAAREARRQRALQLEVPNSPCTSDKDLAEPDPVWGHCCPCRVPAPEP